MIEGNELIMDFDHGGDTIQCRFEIPNPNDGTSDELSAGVGTTLEQESTLAGGRDNTWKYR